MRGSPASGKRWGKKLIHKKPAILLLCVLLSGCGKSAADQGVRVSFLDDETQRADALEFLSEEGFSRKAMELLRNAMRSVYTEPFQMSMSNFPARVDGYYSFPSGNELMSALPHKLCYANHDYQINCFDTVLLLAEEDMHTKVGLKDQGRVILAPWNRGKGMPQPIPAGSAYDAFRWSYPDWYVTETVRVAGMEWTAKRICLTVGLNAVKVLPRATQEAELKDAVLETLRAHWDAQGLELPKDYEIVLGHNVDMKRRIFLTEHAGILFRGKKHSTYFEKAGGSGPFVMLEFQDDEDLAAWYEGTVSDGPEWGYTHHFMTFNDKKIKQLRPQRLDSLSAASPREVAAAARGRGSRLNIRHSPNSQ